MERIPLLNELERIGVVEEGGCDVGVFLVKEYPRNVRAVLEGIARETGYNPIVHFQVWVGGRDICIGGPPIEGKALVVKTAVPDLEKAVAWAAILYHRLGVPAIHMNLALLASACEKHGGLLKEYGVPCEVVLPTGPEEGEVYGDVPMPFPVQEALPKGERARAPHVATWAWRDDVAAPSPNVDSVTGLESVSLAGEECGRLALVARDMSPAELREVMDLVPTMKRAAVRRLVRAAADAPDHRIEEAIKLLRNA